MLWSARGWTLHLMLGVGTISRYMSNPRKEHWAAVKWILTHLKGTSSVCLRYGSKKPMLEGFTDSDMSGDLGSKIVCLGYGSGKPMLEGFTNFDMSSDVDSNRSILGYVMTYAGGVVSWQSRLQKVVALSTTEAEYMDAVKA